MVSVKYNEELACFTSVLVLLVIYKMLNVNTSGCLPSLHK